MASFNTSSFPDSLAIAKEETLTIGSIDEIQVGGWPFEATRMGLLTGFNRGAGLAHCLGTCVHGGVLLHLVLCVWQRWALSSSATV